MKDVVFKRNGALWLFGSLLGVWRRRDIWKEQGCRRDACGNKTVQYMWAIKMIDGRERIYYSKKDAIEWIINNNNFARLYSYSVTMTKEEKMKAINNAK